MSGGAPLAGKRALVTGSSAGLGAGIAERLAQDGAEVCLHGRDAERLEKYRQQVAAVGGRVHAVQGSLSTDAEATAVADAVEAAMGGVDILVNNAGGESAGGGRTDWLDVDAETWNATYNSNVASMIRMIRRFVPGMKEKGWGRLIRLSSVSVDTPMSLIPDYQAAKAAIRSLTRSLALTLAGSGITANSVSPGLTLSHGPERWLRGIAADQGWPDDWPSIKANVESLMIKNFAGMIGEPVNIAHVVAFLADPRADFVNAQDIVADGGH